MSTWYNAGFRGVRYREHPTLKHGLMPDRYFVLRYRHDGKRYEEPLGWASNGWTMEKAVLELLKLKESHKLAEGPQTLKEKREIAKAKREKSEIENQKKEKDIMTFGLFWKDHYLPQSTMDKKAVSVNREKDIYKCWLEKNLGRIPLKKIGVDDLNSIKKKMLEKELSPRSIQYALAVIRQIFNYAKKLKYYEGDPPTKEVVWPKIDNRRMRYFTPEEVNKLLKELSNKSTQLYEMTLVCIHCSLRFCEVARLEWQDIITNDGLLGVRDGKNTLSRYVPMTSEVKKLFNSKKKGKPYELIFPSRDGKQMARISRTFYLTVKELGFNDNVADSRYKAVFYTSRHTGASIMVQNGVPLYTVGEMLGHKTPAMTARYSHLSPETTRAASKVLEKALARPIKSKKKT